MTTTREPFPLQWPAGWPRTPSEAREPSRFGTVGMQQIGQTFFRRKGTLSLYDECKAVIWELGHLRAVNIAITSNLPTRRDGKPMATGRTDDPGIAVWWVVDDKEQVMACDRWESPAENLRAIVKSINALRGIERWGSSAIVEKAFAGFNALPPAGGTGDGEPEPQAPEPPRDWMEYFHVSEAASRGGVKKMHRMFAQQLHPDRDRGDHERMQQLNAAWSKAKAWFDWRDKVMGIKDEEE